MNRWRSVGWRSRSPVVVVVVTTCVKIACTGVTGRVRIDENGDRDADYAILDLDPITGRFEMVARYYGEERNYSPVVGKHIHWPGGSDGPAKDVPSCGFLGNDPSCDPKGDFFPA